MRSMHVLHDAVCGVSGDQKRASDHWNWSRQVVVAALWVEGIQVL